MSTVHGTCVAFGRMAVLIRGPSGSGKSSLALRLIDGEGSGLGDKRLKAKLVADDQVLLWVSRKRLGASSAPRLEGLIEVRGVGILRAKNRRRAHVRLVVDLMPAVSIPRLPEEQEGETEIEGITLPRIYIDAASPQAAAVLRAAVSRLGGKRQRVTRKRKV